MRVNLLNIFKYRRTDWLKNQPSLSAAPKIRTVVPTNQAKDFNEWAEYIHTSSFNLKYQLE